MPRMISAVLCRACSPSPRTYPQLKADAQFARLSDELAGTENRISTERRRYNDTVREYNTFIKKFPQNFFARFTGFDAEKYFEAAKGAKQVPKVKFD